MTAPADGSRSRTLMLAIFVPLAVTVVGGLAVEYLKPERSFAPGTPPDSSAKSAAPPGSGVGPKVRQMLARKWHAAEKPTVYGDLEVEFAETGQMVRTYYRRLIPNSITTHSYQVADDGALSSEAGLNLRLVKVTADELVLSWDGTVAHYKRGFHTWEVGLMALGVIFVCVLAAAFKKK